MIVARWRVGSAGVVVVAIALGAWAYSTTRPTAHAYMEPYRADVRCMSYSPKTGRAAMGLVVTNITKTPLRFRGNVIVNIRQNLPTTPDGRAHWRRYATVSGRTPLVTIAPGRTYRWSRVSRPVLRHGSTSSLEAGSCVFYALPPRDPA